MYLYLEPDVAEKLGLKPMGMQERSNRVNSALLRLAGMQLSMVVLVLGKTKARLIIG